MFTKYHFTEDRPGSEATEIGWRQISKQTLLVPLTANFQRLFAIFC
jgi:hypothetical protein